MVLAALVIGLVIGRWSTGTIGEGTSTGPTTTEWAVGWGTSSRMKKWATPRSTTTEQTGAPRAHNAAHLMFPPGSENLAADDTADASYERWRVNGTREFVESYLAAQLPIAKQYDGLPWCKTVAFPRETRWVWANSGGYLIVDVGDGYEPYRSHVIIMRGMNAGPLTAGCT
jgi:hypothetical protein